jgi:hypothetical protein
MPPYEAAAWEEIARWKQRRFEKESRRLVPAAWRERATRAAHAAKDRFEALPGAETFESLFGDAVEGLLDFGARAARASVRREAVVRAYQKRAYEVSSLGEVRALGLEDIDKVKPRLDLAYIATSAVEGAGSGLAVSGGEILAAGGSLLGAGATAAPGAATVAGVMAADIAATILATQRVVAHVAAYYGYDVNQLHEQIFALGVMNVVFGKGTAYRELNDIVQRLARRQTWDQLGGNAVTKIVRRVYKALGMNLTQSRLGQAVPGIGIAIGAGLNARTLARAHDDAEHLYRERFLAERYGLDSKVPTAATEDEPAMPVADIIDAELVDEREEP